VYRGRWYLGSDCRTRGRTVSFWHKYNSRVQHSSIIYCDVNITKLQLILSKVNLLGFLECTSGEPSTLFNIGNYRVVVGIIFTLWSSNGCGRNIINICVFLSEALFRLTSKNTTFRLSLITLTKNQQHLFQTVANLFIARGGADM